MRESFRKLSYLFDRREKRNALILLGLMAIATLLEVAGVGAIPAFVALLSDPERILRIAPVRDAFERFGILTDRERVLWGALVLVGLFVVKNAYLTGLAFVQARYLFNRQASLSNRLFRAYLHSPYTFHLQHNTALLLRNTQDGAFLVVNDGLFPGLRILMEALLAAALLTLLVAVEPLVTLSMVLVLGGAVRVFFWAVRQKIAQLSTDEHHYRGKLIQCVHSGLEGVKEIKVLGRVSYFLHNFSEDTSSLTRALRYKHVVLELPRLFLETVAVIAMLAVAGFLIHAGRPPQSIVPVLTLFAMAAVRLIPSINRIVNAVVSLRWGRHALDVVYTDLKELERSSEQGQATSDAPGFQRAVEFANVSYRYPGAAREVLRGISFEIRKGSSVGFVGPSGAGKTTAVDVLLGLLEPTAGRVLVDGKDIRADLAAWQRQIGYVPQNIYLADDTLRRNIAFGVPDEEIDDASLWAAVRAAQLQNLMDSLPDGLNTLIGERGIRLSGGQRQRIGIARALYHNPSVLVMDEGTSALDHETESEVVRAINRLSGERTVIVIAHRTSTLADCDEILSIRDGRIETRDRRTFSEEKRVCAS